MTMILTIKLAGAQSAGDGCSLTKAGMEEKCEQGVDEQERMRLHGSHLVIYFYLLLSENLS
jgi:hypothetical protein